MPTRTNTYSGHHKDHCVPVGHFDHTNHYDLNMAKGSLNENVDEGTRVLGDGGLKWLVPFLRIKIIRYETIFTIGSRVGIMILLKKIIFSRSTFPRIAIILVVST